MGDVMVPVRDIRWNRVAIYVAMMIVGIALMVVSNR